MDSTSPGQHLPWTAPWSTSGSQIFLEGGGCATILFVGFKHVSVRREEKLSIFNNKYSVTENAKVFFALFKGHKVNFWLIGFILNRQVVHYHVDPRRGTVRVEAGGGESGPRVRTVGDRGEQTHSTENKRRNHRAGLGVRAGRTQMHEVAKENG